VTFRSIPARVFGLLQVAWIGVAAIAAVVDGTAQGGWRIIEILLIGALAFTAVRLVFLGITVDDEAITIWRCWWTSRVEWDQIAAIQCRNTVWLPWRLIAPPLTALAVTCNDPRGRITVYGTIGLSNRKRISLIEELSRRAETHGVPMAATAFDLRFTLLRWG
jgi:hypothetical protein